MVATLNEGNYLNNILIELGNKSVSDIHIKSNSKIYYRLNGDIKIFEDSKELTSDEIMMNLDPVLNDRVKSFFVQNMQADFGFTTSSGIRYRANLYRTTDGISLALRIINNKLLSLDELKVPEVFKKIASLQTGLVIISGPTGSGKSTTLNSLIDYINENYCKHIITLEDPIEFIHTNKKCLIDQREIGNDATSFGTAIKAALREDPDIILIGEIRDSESIKECLNAAETGHLVFTTMHTQTASKSVDRIIDSCEANEKELVRSMLSTSIQAVVLQKLLKTRDNNSRIAAFEVLLGINSVRNLIRENKIANIDSMIQIGSKYGMISMKNSIEQLYANGLISKEERDKNLINLNDTREG